MKVTSNIGTVGHSKSFGEQLIGVKRCSHCGIAKPLLVLVWASAAHTPRGDGGKQYFWGAYRCQSCGSIVATKGNLAGNEILVEELFPSPKQAHEDLPQVAKVFLQQAYETLHAPDAAAVMAGSAVDAMLKDRGYKDGSLYSRIDKALADNVLTKGMADWAHEVRLGSNRPRHADEDRPHISAHEAQQSVEYAEALGNFLFVLTAKIDRGIKAAKDAET